MNKIELLCRIIELCLTTIGLILVVFGWIIPYKQSQMEERNKRNFEEKIIKMQWEKELVEKQITDLYEPISALLSMQSIRFKLIQYQLGRKDIFGSNQNDFKDLPENEQKIWIHFVNTYVLPTNLKILDILENNQQLLYKMDIPSSLRAFREYVLGWELLDNQKKNEVPNYYEYYYITNFPIEFSNYIYNTLKELHVKQSKLMQEVNDMST